MLWEWNNWPTSSFFSWPSPAGQDRHGIVTWKAMDKWWSIGQHSSAQTVMVQSEKTHKFTLHNLHAHTYAHTCIPYVSTPCSCTQTCAWTVPPQWLRVRFSSAHTKTHARVALLKTEHAPRSYIHMHNFAVVTVSTHHIHAQTWCQALVHQSWYLLLQIP